MNDQDYIRKAVELADGWRILDGDLVKPDDTHAADFLNELSQLYIDALAARLVRQVDATKKHYVTTGKQHACIFEHPYEGTSGQVHCENGPDRTTNTIKAIVDSGVLTYIGE